MVAKTSAGAVSYIPVARVANIPSLLKDLKKQGVWVFGTAADGTTDLYTADLKGPAAIVIGSEGSGMTRLVSENCDFLVSIPMKGRISSLNASAAAAGTQELFDANFQGPTAIVIGNEGAGMGRLVRQTCDVLVRIPMRGRISSLNASAAAAILLYEAVRQRS